MALNNKYCRIHQVRWDPNLLEQLSYILADDNNVVYQHALRARKWSGDWNSKMLLSIFSIEFVGFQGFKIWLSMVRLQRHETSQVQLGESIGLHVQHVQSSETMAICWWHLGLIGRWIIAIAFTLITRNKNLTDYILVMAPSTESFEWLKKKWMWQHMTAKTWELCQPCVWCISDEMMSQRQ